MPGETTCLWVCWPSFPQVSLFDGILGGSFLEHITLKLASSYLLVSAVLNHTESVLLLLDTGASRTLMTP
jgi:hypothetical protein